MLDFRRRRFAAIVLLCGIFMTGFLSAYVLAPYLSFALEQPFSYFASSEGKSAPHDFLGEENILVYKDKIVIEMENASLSSYASTGSMLPFFGEGANGIRIKPDSPDDIQIGDIITFEKDARLIVHRVVAKGEDDKGIYFITKGDNNSITDGKIRFKDVRYLTIGILY